jgi:hypothetical protein
VPDDVRQQEHRSAEAVIALLVDAAAAAEQEALQLRAGVMHSTGRGPALRAAEDAFGPVLRAHPLQLGIDELERRVPVHLDVSVVSRAPPVTMLQPSSRTDGLRDARFGIHHLGQGTEQRRGRWIERKRIGAHESALARRLR